MLVKSFVLRAEARLSVDEPSELSLRRGEENEGKLFKFDNAGGIGRDEVVDWTEKATEGLPWKGTIAKATKRHRIRFNMALNLMVNRPASTMKSGENCHSKLQYWVFSP